MGCPDIDLVVDGDRSSATSPDPPVDISEERCSHLRRCGAGAHGLAGEACESRVAETMGVTQDLILPGQRGTENQWIISSQRHRNPGPLKLGDRYLGQCGKHAEWKVGRRADLHGHLSSTQSLQ